MSAIETTFSFARPSADVAKTKLRDTIDQVVGAAFYGPLLASARNSTLKSDVGRGGRGEEVFKAQLDQVLAEHAGGATNASINDVLYARFEPAALRASEGQE